MTADSYLADHSPTLRLHSDDTRVAFFGREAQRHIRIEARETGAATPERLPMPPVKSAAASVVGSYQ